MAHRMGNITAIFGIFAVVALFSACNRAAEPKQAVPTPRVLG